LAILIAVVVLLILVNSKKKTFDKRVSLSYKQDHPYGTKVLHQLIPILLPNATVEINKQSPLEWYYKNDTATKNALFILVTQHFNPEAGEMELLNRFVENGNSLFIISPTMNEIALNYFDINVGNENFNNNNQFATKPIVYLNKPVFFKDTAYTYPGYTFSNTFKNIDTNYYRILGTSIDEDINFITASNKKGNIYLHNNPFLFTNYFLLHKNNIGYLEKTFALFPTTTKQVIWDEYFIYKLNKNEEAKNPSPLRVLLSIKAFRWAFWLAIAILTMYLLLNVKRNQRTIPVIEKPKNESLDFVKTIGKLYYEKQDHLNLAQKMCTYFLEHIRSKYFINTSNLNNTFIEQLSGKSGVTQAEVEQLVSSIQAIQIANQISQQQLNFYYQQFNQFYKNTA
jgi:hypothetical protein